MRLVESIMTKNFCYTAGRKIAVKGLMLHSAGCPQPKTSAFINSWNRADYTRACVHGFIDALDGTVYQTLPWDHRGWHGGGASNNTHIGVEICEPGCITYIGGANFNVAAGKLEEAKACAKRTYEAAVYPAEPDPEQDGKGMMDADCPFLVRVRIADLNIRKGVGTDTAKTGKYTGKGVFTIVEVRQGKGSDKGWGRLKFGAGWIALSYCERV